jgi:hypothetical protein
MVPRDFGSQLDHVITALRTSGYSPGNGGISTTSPRPEPDTTPRPPLDGLVPPRSYDQLHLGSTWIHRLSIWGVGRDGEDA